jgi:hypothetical protein
MHRIVQSHPTRILGDDKFTYRARAGALVEKWTPPLTAYAKTFLWIAEGDTDLVYASRPEYRENDNCTSVERQVEHFVN